MRKILKLIGFAGVTVGLFFIVSILAFYYLIRVGEFRRFLIDEIEHGANLKLQLGAADLEVGWIMGIVFRNIAISDSEAAQPAITAERLTARVALLPLLHRQVVFYEIRLQRPTAQLVRDKDGRIPLLDKLLNLPFLKQTESEFSLDLRTIKLQGADIHYADQRPESALGTWRLVNADVELERVRGQRLRDFMRQFLKHEPSDSRAAALEFDLRSAVVKDNAKMNLKAQGRLLFPNEALELREARWIADVELVDFPASLIKDHAGARLPIKSLTGHLGQRIHLEGNPATQLHVKSDLELKQLSVDAPELFLTPVTGVDGRMNFEVDWSHNYLRVLRADFRAKDIKFWLQGDVDARDSKDPHFRFSLSALPAPVSVLRKYLPLKIVDSSKVEKTVNSIQSGRVEIKKAGINATLGQLRRLAQTGTGKQVWFEAELRDIAGTLGGEGSLPLRSVDGKVILENGILAFRNIRGAYGDSRFSDVDGSYVLSPTEKGKLELELKGDVNLAELKEQVKAGLFTARAAKIASSLQDLGGRSKINFALKRLADAPLQFDGKIALENARVRYDDHSFSDVQGEVTFTPNEIKTERLRAQVSGSPVQLQLAIKDYDSEDGTFDLGIESAGVRAGVVTSLLLDTGTLKDTGTVRGAVRYSGSFNTKVRRKFVGDLDLQNVQMTIRPLLQPLRELNGKIKIDEAGVDFQNINASLAGFPASASGRWRYGEKTQLLFDFSAPNLDITYLISQIDPESSEFYANLVAEGKIALSKGRIKNFEFSDLKTNATIDHRVWRLSNVTARSAGGTIVGVTTIFDRPDTLGVVAQPKIQGVPVQSFLNWFNITNTEMTGKVNLTGKLETVGNNDPERKQNLNGAFNLRIEDGTINRMRILVQILNLLDLSRWFTLQLPDLSKEGIRFRSITGDFKVNKGVYSTENLVVDSSDLRMTGSGRIDVPKDELDFVVAVRPFAGIDSAMNYIPILGRGIAAIKNSFLVASFNITGSIDDPTITPAPLGTLAEWFWGVLGIPKNIIGSGEVGTEEPTEAANSVP